MSWCPLCESEWFSVEQAMAMLVCSGGGHAVVSDD